MVSHVSDRKHEKNNDNTIDITRRAFVSSVTKVTFGSCVALSFGTAIASMLGSDKGARIAMIYASRYGSTADNELWIAEGIDRDVTLLDTEKVDISTVIGKYDAFVVGSGVWREGVHEAIKAMMVDYADVFDKKLLASFVVCGTQLNNAENRARIAGYFAGIHHPLKKPPLLSQALGGRLNVEKLSDQDRELLTHFYQNILKTELVSWDRTDPVAARDFGQRFKTEISI